jgi:cytidylate kinase
MKKDVFSIAVDGPAGAGKSTIAKKIAKALDIEYIDTGAMYRALTLKAIENNLNPQNPEEVINILSDTDIDFIDNHIFIDGKQVDEEIRENIINKNVSYVATIKEVRDYMVKLQKGMAKKKSLIMDGRDITSVVLPNADYKFFITASVKERGKRRYKELIENGEKNISLEQIIMEIKRRDDIDSNRKIAPLIKTQDAYLLDTTNKTIDECINEIVSIVMGGK